MSYQAWAYSADGKTVQEIDSLCAMEIPSFLEWAGEEEGIEWVEYISPDDAARIYVP